MITKALLYCTKNKPYLVKSNGTVERMEQLYNKDFVPKQKKFELYDFKDGGYSAEFYDFFNGHVVAVCDIEVEEVRPFFHWCKQLEKATGLTCDEVLDYLDKKDKSVSNPKRQAPVYLIHIKNLKVLDEPHKLGETFDIKYTVIYESVSLPKKAPQNMQRVYVDMIIGDFVEPVRDYVLISIQPQWLVKILNGEKTIEVRKKVLRNVLCQD